MAVKPPLPEIPRVDPEKLKDANLYSTNPKVLKYTEKYQSSKDKNHAGENKPDKRQRTQHDDKKAEWRGKRALFWTALSGIGAILAVIVALLIHFGLI